MLHLQIFQVIAAIFLYQIHQGPRKITSMISLRFCVKDQTKIRWQSVILLDFSIIFLKFSRDFEKADNKSVVLRFLRVYSLGLYLIFFVWGTFLGQALMGTGSHPKATWIVLGGKHQNKTETVDLQFMTTDVLVIHITTKQNISNKSNTKILSLPKPNGFFDSTKTVMSAVRCTREGERFRFRFKQRARGGASGGLSSDGRRVMDRWMLIGSQNLVLREMNCLKVKDSPKIWVSHVWLIVFAWSRFCFMATDVSLGKRFLVLSCHYSIPQLILILEVMCFSHVGSPSWKDM